MDKQETRKWLKKQMNEFLANGGKIEVLPPQKVPKQKVTRGSISWGGQKMRRGERFA